MRSSPQRPPLWNLTKLTLDGQKGVVSTTKTENVRTTENRKYHQLRINTRNCHRPRTMQVLRLKCSSVPVADKDWVHASVQSRAVGNGIHFCTRKGPNPKDDFVHKMGGFPKVSQKWLEKLSVIPQPWLKGNLPKNFQKHFNATTSRDLLPVSPMHPGRLPPPTPPTP